MDRLEIYQLGVGHGDATLLRWFGPASWTCHVDGGPSASILDAPLKKKYRVDALDVLYGPTEQPRGLYDIERESAPSLTFRSLACRRRGEQCHMGTL